MEFVTTSVQGLFLLGAVILGYRLKNIPANTHTQTIFRCGEVTTEEVEDETSLFPVLDFDVCDKVATYVYNGRSLCTQHYEDIISGMVSLEDKKND